jgi:hypothetical protein
MGSPTVDSNILLNVFPNSTFQIKEMSAEQEHKMMVEWKKLKMGSKKSRSLKNESHHNILHWKAMYASQRPSPNVSFAGDLEKSIDWGSTRNLKAIVKEVLPDIQSVCPTPQVSPTCSTEFPRKKSATTSSDIISGVRFKLDKVIIFWEKISYCLDG